MATPFWHTMLPRLGSDADFAATRDLFRCSGFDYAAVCEKLGAAHLYLVSNTLEKRYLEHPVAGTLDTLIRLFVIGRQMDRPTIERELGAASFTALEALGLLAPVPDSADAWFAPVMLHPAPASALVICDRSVSPDGATVFKRATGDVLYPALFQNTMDFVARFPAGPCERILEIGTGTGIAAITWADRARQVWATDITPRAVHFAEFNRRLAGAGNIKIVEGDMYAPVEGLAFDRIAAHPPFVPSRNSAVIFRDGGEDGEQLIRRVVEGLPRFLSPGGMFWGSFMISDRAGESAERRLRKWLGDAQAEFDIAVALDGRRTPGEMLASTLSTGTADVEEGVYFQDLWKTTKTEALLLASVLICRRAAAGGCDPVDARTEPGKGFTAGDLAWLIGWHCAFQKPGFSEAFLEARLVLAPECELRISHRFENGKPVTEEYTFNGLGPIHTACGVAPWAAKMLVACDGSRSVREWFDALRAGGQIPQDAQAAEFIHMLGGLIAAGVLRPIESVTV